MFSGAKDNEICEAERKVRALQFALEMAVTCKGFVFYFQQQLQTYVAWVNSQLKKKPAVKPVQDLRQDLRDGVILALLIEIVGQ